MSSAIGPAATAFPLISLPLSPSDDALTIFNSSLRTSSIDIMHESGVQWTTLSILRRGTDPRNFDQCPPTIVITALDAEPLKQQAWRSVESKIRTELGKHKDIGIQVEIIHDVPVLFHGQDMGVPYPFPRPIGYSLGVSMEGIGKNDDNYSGTLGGYLSILNKTNIQFVLTCNHVANPRALIASDAAPEDLEQHETRCPSNQDHAESIRQAAANLVLNTKESNFNESNQHKKDHLHNVMQSLGHNFPYPPTSHEEMKFPYGTGQKTAVAYDKFFVAALKKDYVTAMDFLPTADELHANEEAISKCKFGKTMSDLRNTFDSVWNEASAGQAYTNYKQAQQAQRKFGTTKCASGLRVWSDDKNQLGIVELGIVDWALVEVPEPQKNIIPDNLKSLADKISPGCPLAKGTPITKFGPPIKGEDIVFKVGRTSGATAGKVDPSKVTIQQLVWTYNNILPADGILEGQVVKETREWNIVGKPVLEEGQQETAQQRQFAYPGDSGAWVINTEAELVGMVFCGMSSVGHTYVQDMCMIRDSVRKVTGFDLDFAQ